MVFAAGHPEFAADIASRYIGIHAGFALEALGRTPPNTDALDNTDAVAGIIEPMQLGYIERRPSGFVSLDDLDAAKKAPEA